VTGLASTPSAPLWLDWRRMRECVIAARAVQGSGGAMLAATSVAILVSVHAPGERGKVLGINAAALYSGAYPPARRWWIPDPVLLAGEQ
jgi:MFS family permease